MIIKTCSEDSYIVRLKNGRYVKKRYYDPKGLSKKTRFKA